MWFRLRLIDKLDSFLSNEETLWQLLSDRKSRCAVTPPTLHLLALRCRLRTKTTDSWLLAARLHQQVAKTKRTVPLERAVPWIEFCFLGEKKKTCALAHLFADAGTWTGQQRRPSPGWWWSVRLGERCSCRFEGREGRLCKRQESTRCFKLHKHVGAIRKQRLCALWGRQKNQEKLPDTYLQALRPDSTQSSQMFTPQKKSHGLKKNKKQKTKDCNIFR